MAWCLGIGRNGLEKSRRRSPFLFLETILVHILLIVNYRFPFILFSSDNTSTAVSQRRRP